MYVAVRRYEGATDMQKVAKLVEEHFVPIISELPGFVAYYLVDAGDGVIATTSIFEHKDAEEESTFLAGEFVAEHLVPWSRTRPKSQPVRLPHTRWGRRDTQREFEIPAKLFRREEEGAGVCGFLSL